MRILIVDDQEFIRRGIRAVLSDAEDIEVCGEAIDGHEAILKTRELKPDIVVMDISMPRLDGIEATREIRALFPHVRILTLSQYELPDVMKEALEAGASTHVSKIYVWTQLVPALRRVRLGDTFFDGNFAGGVDLRLGEARRARLELEKALLESEERFRSTFELSAVGIGHASADGQWLRANQRLCEMLGYSKEEMHRLRVQDITHPEDLAADLALGEKLAAGEIEHYDLDKRLIRKDGEAAWIHLTAHAVRDAKGTLKYTVRVAEDSAAKREAAENLIRAKRELQSALGHLDFVASRMDLALTHCSRDLRYLWVNQNYANWLALPVERIIGRAILDVVGSAAFQKLRRHFDQVLAGETVEYEDHVIYEAIGRRHIRAAYTPIFGSNGVPDGWFSLVRDLSSNRNAEPASAD